MAMSFPPFLVQNLYSLIEKEVGLLLGVDKEMKKLSSTLSTIQAVLEDAEQKQLQDRAIQNWLRKLKDAAYVVDDILDDCATEALRCESQKKVRTSLLTYPVKHVMFRHKIGNRMKEIIESLNAIADERKKFHLREAVVDKRVVAAESRETSSFLTQPEIYGRDEDKEKIVKVLVENVCDSEDVSVYPIVGMGGLGKTTLAQMAFNDERVKRHFEQKIWVYVSQDFDVKRVIKAIIESVSGEPCKVLDLDPLQRNLQYLLNGKRYLLVLDDVWDEDQEKWDRFKCVLACGSKGASIIVTTRIEKVASIMGTVPQHHLPFLSEDQSWMLFRQRAFGHKNEERPNLVAIGKEIVKKCGGVPLAAKTLGGLMRFKNEEKDWVSVKESEIWNLPQDENSILPALRLSYYNLALELRQCFAFCAIFPKGSKIKKENLIRLWMANGYIPCKEELELEDIGDQIWSELCWRSFFQDVEKDQIHGMTSFKMHDLVHDLAKSIMDDECYIMEVRSSRNISKRVRHVTLETKGYRIHNFPDVIHKAIFLRTIQVRGLGHCVRGDGTDEFLCDLTKFGSLRVFDVRFTEINMVPSSIGNLKHMRYLNFSCTQITQLPDSICSLWNLQTLVVEHCQKLKRLPKDMKYLRSLRHLYLTLGSIDDMPPKIGQLTCLKTLSLFVVGKSRDCSHLGELQCLNLGGEFCIEHLERVRNPMDAKEANLVGKPNLHWLKLFWEVNDEYKSQENVEQILQALEPHPNLKGLVIQQYKGNDFPIWMMTPILQSVVEIILENCKNCSQLPPFGKLPLLRRLRIRGMDKVEYIHNCFLGGGNGNGSDSGEGRGSVKEFPSLEKLVIGDLPNLKGLSSKEGREFFPRLHLMIISNCPNLSFPPLSSLRRLTVWSKCTNVVLNSISNVIGLTSLEVNGNEEAICFPEEVLRNLALLESLTILCFTELESLRLRGLKSLKNLEVGPCYKMSAFEGLQHLTALKNLSIIKCRSLLTLPESIKHLKSLESLFIDGCSQLLTLPESIKHLKSLESLFIDGCSQLTSFPDCLGNLSSLQLLDILRCDKSIDDYEKFASLLASIQGPTKLRRLTIHCNYEGTRQRVKEFLEQHPLSDVKVTL